MTGEPRPEPSRAIAWALAAAFAALLAMGICGAITVAILLAGEGALLLGPRASSRAAALSLIAASLLAGALALEPLRRCFQRLPRAEETPSQARIPRWLAALAWSALAVQLFVLVEQVRRWPDAGWDAWMIWNLRARALLRTGGDLALACSNALAQADFGFHPSYPLMRPGLVALGFRAAGAESPWVSSGLSFACAAVVAALLFAEVARRRGKRAGVLAATLFATIPLVAEQASGGIAETMLCAFVLGGAVLLSISEDLSDAPGSRQQTAVCLAGLSLGLATSVKNEGALFLLALCAAAGPKRAWRMLLGAAAPVALTLWFKLGVAPLDDLITTSMGARFWLAFEPRRIAMLLFAAARRVVFFQLWGVHLIAALAFLLGARWRSRLSPLSRRLLLAVALALVGDAAVYLTTPWDLDWHLRTSIDRLILQISPLLLLALGISWPAEEKTAREHLPSDIPPARI